MSNLELNCYIIFNLIMFYPIAFIARIYAVLDIFIRQRLVTSGSWSLAFKFHSSQVHRFIVGNFFLKLRRAFFGKILINITFPNQPFQATQ